MAIQSTSAFGGAAVQSDAELIAAVRTGDVDAYGLLFERHSPAALAVAKRYTNSSADADDLVAESFTAVLSALRSGKGPDTAFRMYLFTTIRNNAAHNGMRAARAVPTDNFEGIEPLVEFDDPALAAAERGFVERAYASLPERWRAVLWHTTVEGLSAAEVAPILGLTANGVSALAYRAREGLRQAYLQQHLSDVATVKCGPAAEKLGAYARGGLSAREARQVEDHLDSCARCKAVLAEIGDVSHGMNSVIAPLLLGTAVTAALKAGLLKTALPMAAASAKLIGASVLGAASFKAITSGGAFAASAAGLGVVGAGGAASTAAASGAAGGAATGGPLSTIGSWFQAIPQPVAVAAAAAVVVGASTIGFLTVSPPPGNTTADAPRDTATPIIGNVSVNPSTGTSPAITFGNSSQTPAPSTAPAPSTSGLTVAPTPAPTVAPAPTGLNSNGITLEPTVSSTPVTPTSTVPVPSSSTPNNSPTPVTAPSTTAPSPVTPTAPVAPTPTTPTPPAAPTTAPSPTTPTPTASGVGGNVVVRPSLPVVTSPPVVTPPVTVRPTVAPEPRPTVSVPVPTPSSSVSVTPRPQSPSQTASPTVAPTTAPTTTRPPATQSPSPSASTPAPKPTLSTDVETRTSAGGLLSVAVATNFSADVPGGVDPVPTPSLYTATPNPTVPPTAGEPTGEPTEQPTGEPTEQPTGEPTEQPTGEPTEQPTGEPTEQPTGEPTEQPTEQPTGEPTEQPTGEPTEQPTGEPTEQPTGEPTEQPTGEPTEQPTGEPTEQPTGEPTAEPTPSVSVTAEPTTPATTTSPSGGLDANIPLVPTTRTVGVTGRMLQEVSLAHPVTLELSLAIEPGTVARNARVLFSVSPDLRVDTSNIGNGWDCTYLGNSWYECKNPLVSADSGATTLKIGIAAQNAVAAPEERTVYFGANTIMRPTRFATLPLNIV